MGLSKQQESIIIDILGFPPETWAIAITRQADKIPEENRVEFGERLLNKIASHQSKAQHAASILRRGPNLDPSENLKAFSLVHASYLARLFIAHPTLCERLCVNLTKTQDNHGWEGEISRFRAIETHKLEIKDYIAEEINRTPVDDIDESFSLIDMMAAIEYVGQHPSICRKMFDLWPEYYIFQEYSLEAWKVIEEEVEEEKKEMQRTYLSNTVTSTRTTRSGADTDTFAVDDPLPHPPATSINQGKRYRPNFRGNEAKDDKEGKGPTSKRARHDHQDQSLSLSSPLKLQGDVGATNNIGIDGSLDSVHGVMPTGGAASDGTTSSMKKVGSLVSPASYASQPTTQAPPKPPHSPHQGKSKTHKSG